MIKTLQVNSPRSKYEHILNQREILNTIDLCPRTSALMIEIIKQDKLFIRNKIKDIFKDHQINECVLSSENDNQFNENYELLSIFNQCKKPLNKIHLFENHWHWLQVRLRKYVILQKKKIKEECINQYKKQRLVEKCKNNNQFKRKFKEDVCSNRKQNKYAYETSIKANRSQENRRPQSPNNMSYQLCQTARLRNLSGNMSPKYGTLGNQFRGAETCKNSSTVNHYSNQNSNWNQYNKTQSTKNSKMVSNTYQYFRKQAHSQQKQKTQHQYQYPLKHPHPTAHPTAQPTPQPTQELVPTPTSLHHKFFQEQQQQIQKEMNRIIGKSSRLQKQEDVDFDIYDTYQFTDESQYRNCQKEKDREKKAGQGNFSVGEEFSTIKGKEQGTNREIERKNQGVSNFYESGHGGADEGIFTSPELLQQCRRLIEISTKLNKSRPKSKNKEKVDKKQSRQSANVFEKIQYPQHRSPEFCKQLPKFKDIKDILHHIFYKDWNVYISTAEKQQLFERCPSQCLNQLQLLMNQIEEPTKFLSFLQIFPLLKNHLNIKFVFSNIFLLLDIDSKGTVEHSDYETFIQNFIDSPIDPQVLLKLKQKLNNFQKITKSTFEGRVDVREGCFEYLELVGKKQIYQLGEILQLFEFQIDTAGNNANLNLDKCYRETWQ